MSHQPPLHSRLLRRFAHALCVTAGLALAGCISVPTPGVYKIDVQQGNVITAEMLAALEPGMEKRKVRFLLGTPLVTDTFDPDRWDYIYSFQEGGGERVQRHVVAIFEDDRLLRVEGDVTPSEFASLPDATPDEVITVPDQESDTLLGGITGFFGDKDRLPLEEKPDEDGVDESFFGGVFGGDGDADTSNNAANRDDGDISNNANSVQPAASDEDAAADVEASEETAEQVEEVDEDEELGFFERLSNKFGLEPPPEGASGNRRE